MTPSLCLYVHWLPSYCEKTTGFFEEFDEFGIDNAIARPISRQTMELTLNTIVFQS
ncbi:hypothetical protein O3M35_010861 [Rhynocoris fuscipes]|uniref:Uncharacterized protein n=1 Tax=Rhynocoris fuscipes TaxID=488301 RepID=A0AAW1D3A9_9HEMI